MKNTIFLAVMCLLGVTQGLPQELIESLPQGLPPNNIEVILNQYGYEDLGGGKYALVVTGYNTWHTAQSSCEAQIPGATLFVVNSPQDSKWLGERINFQKDRVDKSSKFWVGLVSESPAGPLKWIDGTPYQHYPEVVQADGFDDETKKYAWAVPDGLGVKLKYEFLTASDEAEAFICQYLAY